MDEHIPRAVTGGLLRRGVDVLTAQDASMLEASDHDHLELASKENRIIFTQDADFLCLHQAGVSHSGIIYVPQQTSIGYIVRKLMTIHDLINPAEMKNRVEFL
jgi:hypothetical protein